jgi:phage gpG-like protein
MFPDAQDIINRVEQKALKKAGEGVLRFFLNTFTKEGFYDNGEFIPWAQRKNLMNKKPILYKTGDLKKAFHIEYSKSEFKIFNTKEYSKYHNEGTEHLPKRPIIYDDKKVSEIINKAVEEELDKIFNNLPKK